MNNISRRSVFKFGGAALGISTIAVLPGLKDVCDVSKNSRRSDRKVKLVPIKGVSYSPATLAFMESSRFESPKHAIYGLRNPNIEFYLEYIES